MRVVFASRNAHKARQVAELLPGFDIVALDEVASGLRLEEPYNTFEANALAKARTAALATHMPAIADDSGIEVDALGGEPGVRSARWAGDHATDEDNNSKLVKALADVSQEQLSCRYRCAAAFVSPEGIEVVTRGECAGTIVLEPRGDQGFGYDPYVIPDGETRTMAEIPLEEKLTFSHRGKAFRALAERLAEIYA